MEMEAGGALSSKRRKSAAPVSKEEAPTPAVTVGADHRPTTEERSTCSQEPPPGVDEDGGGADRISDLTDAVLGEIISLLPTKEGARTQILASRWRHLWRSAPLNLDCDELSGNNDAVASVVSRILSTHLGPGRRLCLHTHHHRDPTATVDAWLRSPALDNLQELDFYTVIYPRRPPQPLPLPASTLRFSSTLRVATIGLCHLPDSTVQGLHFPQLKQLGLEEVRISECSLHSMIARCPALECLLINCSFGFRCVRINSLTLISIAMHVDGDELQLEELVIENAPCLERLLHQDQHSGLDLHVMVISAPKLETLGFFYEQHDRSRLVFGSTVIQGLHIDSLTTVVHTIKILAVEMYILSLDAIIDLMRCFPCLEKLYIQSNAHAAGEKILWRRKHQKFIRRLDIHLKTIVLYNYSGTTSQVNFATFFVLNARVLELMTLQVEHNNEEFMALQQRKLLLDKRVSRGARFHFSTVRCFCSVQDIRHVSDLHLSDPFEC